MMRRIVLLLLIVAILIGMYSILSINKMTLKGVDTYTYISDQQVGFSDEYELSVSDNITKLKFQGKNYFLNAMPLYYVNDTRILLTNDMLAIDIKTGNMKKLNRYTEIYLENNQYYVTEKNKKTTISNMILFDGKSTYVSLVNGSIKSENKDYLVTPFSTITVESKINLYNYDKNIYQELIDPEKLTIDGMEFLDVENNIITIKGNKVLLIQDFEKIENFI
ncbi:MAG: hypothetical protein ACRCUP_01180 [Mycoplasmatales bacterium]